MNKSSLMNLDSNNIIITEVQKYVASFFILDFSNVVDTGQYLKPYTECL